METRRLVAVASCVVGLFACSSDVASPTTSTGGSSGGGGASSSGGGGGSSGGASSSSGAASSSGAGSSSGGSSSGGSSSGAPVQTETWKDGKQITANLDVLANAAVTLDLGARIDVTAGVTITVHGSLQGDTRANHAKLSGSTWKIVVAQGGTLSMNGVNLVGGTLETLSGNGPSKYAYGTMDQGAYVVGGTLAVDHTAVTAGGQSSVTGALSATFLDYSGLSVAVMGGGSLTVSDSKITGTGGDFFQANDTSAAKLVHVEYSTITGTHCPFHFQNVAVFQLDHVSTSGNAFGQMLYNDNPGPHSISYCSFADPNFSQDTRDAVIAIDHTYIQNTTIQVGQVTVTNPASAPRTDGVPRGTPGPNG